jgi:hypothetical protein
MPPPYHYTQASFLIRTVHITHYTLHSVPGRYVYEFGLLDCHWRSKRSVYRNYEIFLAIVILHQATKHRINPNCVAGCHVTRCG